MIVGKPKVQNCTKSTPSGRIGTKVSSAEGMKSENNNAKRLTKHQVIAELEKMKGTHD
jgi:transcription factor MYB, plant